jgi:uncharacterized membrane-anchored protein YhcB (DUF1043 family)
MTLFILSRLIYEAYFRFPHFKILKAGMRQWMNKNKEQLTSYQIELKTKKSSSELVFEELWIDEKKYRFHLSREDRKIAGNFTKKEILKLNVISEIKNDNENEIPSKSSRGILVLGYRFKNKRKFLSVKKLKNIDYLRLSGTN